MARISPQARIAHAFAKLVQGRRLITEAERELRQAMKEIQAVPPTRVMYLPVRNSEIRKLQA